MRRIIRITFGILCILFVFSSCVTNKQTELMQNIAKDYPKLSKPEEYKIIPGDQLTIKVYTMDETAEELFKMYVPGFTWEAASDGTGGNESMSRHREGAFDTKPIPVYADGTINFPHTGRVYVEGFTILEIRNILTERVDEIAEGTSVEVSLFNRYFSVLGEMGASRIAMTNNQITIFQALATAPNISPTGDKSKVSILRQTKDGSILKTFDLRSQNILDSEFYYIQANDVIYVPQAKRKFLGAPSSFVGLFGLLTSIAGIVVFAFRII